MQSVKSVLGIVAGLVPVAWLGGLAFYFYRTNEQLGGFAAKELGPTIIGLSVLAGLFAVPLLYKLIRLLAGTAKPARTVAVEVEDAGPGFDADAALARYMARKAAGEFADASRPAGSFGRKSS